MFRAGKKLLPINFQKFLSSSDGNNRMKCNFKSKTVHTTSKQMRILVHGLKLRNSFELIYIHFLQLFIQTIDVEKGLGHRHFWVNDFFIYLFCSSSIKLRFISCCLPSQQHSWAGLCPAPGEFGSCFCSCRGAPCSPAAESSCSQALHPVAAAARPPHAPRPTPHHRRRAKGAGGLLTPLEERGGERHPRYVPITAS